MTVVRTTEGDLARRALLAGLVLLLGMAGLGVWMGQQAEEGLTRGVAITVAHSVDRLMGATVAELAGSPRLTSAQRTQVMQQLVSS